MMIFTPKLPIGNTPEHPDPFDDPVGYLAGFGIEAELVRVEMDALESAA